MRTLFPRGGSLALALIAALAFTVSVADARVGGGRSSGSRGDRTFQAPSSTNVAPNSQNINRSVTQPNQVQRQATPSVGQATAGSRFGGFAGGLFAGLLGAGLIGMLMGGGFLSGLSGLGSILGLLLQVALIGGLIYFAVQFFRRRSQSQQPAYAAPMGRSAVDEGPSRSFGGMGAGGFGAAQSNTVTIEQRDYEQFERLLADLQVASSREDVGTIRRITTPEMASYVEEDIAENQRKGLVNEVSDVKFLDGDLSEAWREGDAEYATVAMRFSMVDVTKERATGRIVDGSTSPVTITEVWTFRRDRGDGWKLSAIQQA
jgi:predicted lipid-binding transport protein (Tim44 family)